MARRQEHHTGKLGVGDARSAPGCARAPVWHATTCLDPNPEAPMDTRTIAIAALVIVVVIVVIVFVL
jgi:hypothetical protein